MDLLFKEITLLTCKEAELLPKSVLAAPGWWWLKDRCGSCGTGKDDAQRTVDSAVTVGSTGFIYDEGFSVDNRYGFIRPALRVLNPEAFRIGVFEKIALFGVTWQRVSYDLLLCDDETFGQGCFDKTTGNYEDSDIKRRIESKAAELCIVFLGDSVKVLEVTYLSKNVPELKYVDGKSDWIDLSLAEDLDIKAGEFKLVSLGVSIRLPDGYEMVIVPRSSLFKNYGIIQANCFGVIDETYGKESSDDVLGFPAYATRDVHIDAGTRICQFRIQEHQPKLRFVTVPPHEGTKRGGFGSTGK